MLSRAARGPFAGSALLLVATGAYAAEGPETGPTEQQIEAFLAAAPATADISTAPDAPEAPPPPPRHHGFVVESSLGAMGQAGDLRHVTPVSPWLHAAFGWEPTHWLMLLAQGDVAFGSTSLANPPPDPRGFALWGLSGALRFGLQPSKALGLYLQGEIGAACVTTDVLRSYGFTDANQVGPYFGADAGLEWYQVSPHYALVVHGGVRSYAQILAREGGSAALAWTSAAGLKYTF